MKFEVRDRGTEAITQSQARNPNTVSLSNLDIEYPLNNNKIHSSSFAGHTSAPPGALPQASAAAELISRIQGGGGPGGAGAGGGPEAQMAMASKPCARLCVIRAEGDGVDPVLVVQVEKGSWCKLNHGTAVGPPQYLFGAPEGLSRLMLTHRRILGEGGPPLPSPSLKAVFVSGLEPEHAGGLVGLFLRLKADGHEKVRQNWATSSTQGSHASERASADAPAISALLSSGPPLRPPRHHGPHGLLLREHSPVGAPPRPGHRAQFGGLLPRDSCILGRPFKRPRVDCGPFGALGWLGRPRERPSSARPFQLCSRWRHARVLKPWPPGSRPKRPDIGALPAAQEDGHGRRRGGLRDRG